MSTTATAPAASTDGAGPAAPAGRSDLARDDLAEEEDPFAIGPHIILGED
jgi:hypothetical protein